MTKLPHSYDLIIVGAGHAGAQAALACRQQGFAGSIALMGDEPDLPYDRPALSKGYLAGEQRAEDILVRPGSFWADHRIAMLLNCRVVAVDPNGHQVTTSEGERLGYRNLVWATGGVPRRLTCSGHDLAGVHTIRARADVDRLLIELERATRVVVIGGGYIGLEAAAVLTKQGKQVTLLEAQDRLLARVAGEALSRFYEAEHRANGVDVRLGATALCIEEQEGRAAAVSLADGERLPCEVVIVGVGIEPAVGPLLAAGAEGHNGVRVDGRCRSSLPDVFAIGDCALHANPFADGAYVRLESIQNANDQAMVVAAELNGNGADYGALPTFWSNQYDLRLQTVGLSIGHDAIAVRGDPASRSFSVVYYKGGTIVALDCVNATKDYVQGRRLVTGRSRATPSLVADAGVPLNRIGNEAAVA